MCKKKEFIHKNLKKTNTEDILQKIEDKQIGIGLSKAHFGEYLQGYFDDINGGDNDRACIAVPLTYSLIDEHLNIDNEDEYYSLPIASSGSIAIYTPEKDEKLMVFPKDKVKSKAAVKKTLKFLKKENYGGYLKIITGGRVAQGLGTSTSDIVASVRAVSNYFQKRLYSDTIAKIAVETEKASDGIMYDNATLFVSTKGRVLTDYGRLFPKTEILGFRAIYEEEGIDTLKIPPRKYDSEQKNKLRNLRELADKAFVQGNVDLIGKISTKSAMINQKFLEKLYLEEIVDISEKNRSKGIVVAHSGTMIGLMFDPSYMPTAKKLAKILEELRNLGFSDFKRYISE